jgi:hypothetical protein
MTNDKTNSQESNEQLVLTLLKTRAKLATAIFQIIDLEVELEQAKQTITTLQESKSESD